MSTKAKLKPPRHLRKPGMVSLNVLVDAALREKAQEARMHLGKTWVEVVESALRAVITAAGLK